MFLKLTLHPEGPFHTPLQGDTFWGHLVWAWCFLAGEDAVAPFLESQEREPWLISSAFPAGYLPRPHLPLPSLKGINIENVKDLKRVIYLPAARLLESCRSLSGETLLQDLLIPAVNTQAKDGSTPGVVRRQLKRHTAIDREKGGALEHQLFEDWDEYLDGDQEVYVSIPDQDHEKFLDCLDYIIETGYGADRSTGSGRFSCDRQKDILAVDNIFCPDSANAWMSLSPFIPEPGFQLKGWYTMLTKWGRLGEPAAMGIPAFKKPLLMLNPGAVFLEAEPARHGQLVTGVHSHDERIRHYGFALPLPLVWKGVA